MGYILKADVAKGRPKSQGKARSSVLFGNQLRSQEVVRQSVEANVVSEKVHSHGIVVNQSLSRQFCRTLVVKTWKTSLVAEVLNTLESLGCKGNLVRSINCKKFLITFPDHEFLMMRT